MVKCRSHQPVDVIVQPSERNDDPERQNGTGNRVADDRETRERGQRLAGPQTVRIGEKHAKKDSDNGGNRSKQEAVAGIRQKGRAKGVPEAFKGIMRENRSGEQEAEEYREQAGPRLSGYPGRSFSLLVV